MIDILIGSIGRYPSGECSSMVPFCFKYMPMRCLHKCGMAAYFSLPTIHACLIFAGGSPGGSSGGVARVLILLACGVELYSL